MVKLLNIYILVLAKIDIQVTTILFSSNNRSLQLIILNRSLTNTSWISHSSVSNLLIFILFLYKTNFHFIANQFFLGIT
jgi:hypothetical protein